MINQAPYTLDLQNVTIDFDKKSYLRIFEKEIITEIIMNENFETSLTGEESKDKPGILQKNKGIITPVGRTGKLTPIDKD